METNVTTNPDKANVPETSDKKELSRTSKRLVVGISQETVALLSKHSSTSLKVTIVNQTEDGEIARSEISSINSPEAAELIDDSDGEIKESDEDVVKRKSDKKKRKKHHKSKEGRKKSKKSKVSSPLPQCIDDFGRRTLSPEVPVTRRRERTYDFSYDRHRRSSIVGARHWSLHE